MGDEITQEVERLLLMQAQRVRRNGGGSVLPEGHVNMCPRGYINPHRECSCPPDVRRKMAEEQEVLTPERMGTMLLGLLGPVHIGRLTQYLDQGDVSALLDVLAVVDRRLHPERYGDEDTALDYDLMRAHKDEKAGGPAVGEFVRLSGADLFPIVEVDEDVVGYQGPTKVVCIRSADLRVAGITPGQYTTETQKRVWKPKVKGESITEDEVTTARGDAQGERPRK